MKTSQCQCINTPTLKTWSDFREQCLMTFGGGHADAEYDAFRHGMETIFNLLESEFPQPIVIRKNTKKIKTDQLNKSQECDDCLHIKAPCKAECIVQAVNGECPYYKGG